MTSPMRIAFALLALASLAFAEEPRTVPGLKNPESVAVGFEGKVFVTTLGERDRPGDGSVSIVDPFGKITVFTKGFDDPKGIIFVKDRLYVVDVKRVWKLDWRGVSELFLAPEDFPRKPMYLKDIAYDGLGNFYVSDSGDRAGRLGAVFRIDYRKRVTQVLDGELTSPRVYVPTGLVLDDADHIFVADSGMGYLYRYDLIIGTPERIGGGFGGADGLSREPGGRLFVSDWTNGRVFQVTSEFEPPGLLPFKFQSVADTCVTPDGKFLLVTDTKAGTLTWLTIR